MKKVYHVAISQRAQDNLLKILFYLETSWTVRIKDKFLNRFIDYVKFIEQNPFLFPVSDYSDEVRRCMITKHNALYYKIVGSEVEIITIHDVRQNPDNLYIENKNSQ
jgi:plasmid stabilization system protein ParE